MMIFRDTRHESESGFTIIEVSISLLFIAFTIIFLTASLMALFGTYNKGIWLGKVDQAVRQMRLDISDSVRFAGRSIVLSDDNGTHRLCSNGVSYLWNTESQLREAGSSVAGYKSLLNHFSDAPGVPLKLVRILDLTKKYCLPFGVKKFSKKIKPEELLQPKIDDTNVQVLLSTGVALQSMKVTQGEYRNTGGKTLSELERIVPILSIKGMISTEGANAPTLVKYDNGASKWTVLRDNEDDSKKLEGSSWQCGDWVDKNHNGIRDENDGFKPNKGQFCANTVLDIIVYEKGVIR